MNKYKYHGINKDGQAVDGWIEASDQKSAILSLSQKGHFVMEMFNSNEKNATTRDISISELLPWKKRIKSKEILEMLNQLAAALKAGLPLLSGLTVIRQQEQNPVFQNLLDTLITDINKGDSLSTAMEKHPQYFRSLACAMVRVGELGGILDQTAERLVFILKREEKIKSDIKVALTYPAFVLSIGLISVAFIVTVILPRILGTLGEAIILPWPTQALLWMNDTIKSYGWLIFIVTSIIVFFAHKFFTSPDGKYKLDKFCLRLPYLGPMLTAIAVGRFTRTLGALARGGVTLLESLGVVKDTLGNKVLVREIEDIQEKVKTGQNLSDAINESTYFPPLLVQVTAMGEQTGDLDILLFNAAETFEEQADTSIEKFMAILPALLMIILFIIIGFIVLAILLPIMGMDFAPTA